jgi:uncharacterized protein (UPF0335 family)
MSEPGHNGIAADQLKAFVERLERLNDEIAALNTDKAELYAEAKAGGFDTKIIRKIIALRKKDHAERQEEATIMELYLSALGMA